MDDELERAGAVLYNGEVVLWWWQLDEELGIDCLHCSKHGQSIWRARAHGVEGLPPLPPTPAWWPSEYLRSRGLAG